MLRLSLLRTEDNRFYLDVVEEDSPLSHGGDEHTFQRPLLAPVSDRVQEAEEARMPEQVRNPMNLNQMDEPAIPEHQLQAEAHLFESFDPEVELQRKKQKSNHRDVLNVEYPFVRFIAHFKIIYLTG